LGPKPQGPGLLGAEAKHSSRFWWAETPSIAIARDIEKKLSQECSINSKIYKSSFKHTEIGLGEAEKARFLRDQTGHTHPVHPEKPTVKVVSLQSCK
jgi:hypothetical protein